MHTLTGQCHCGNVAVALTLPTGPRHLTLYSCRCSYCQLTEPRWLGQPVSRVAIGCEVAEETSLYTMGHRSNDYLICRSCATLVAALEIRQGNLFALINARLLNLPADVTTDAGCFSTPLTEGPEREALFRDVWIHDVVTEPVLAEKLAAIRSNCSEL